MSIKVSNIIASVSLPKGEKAVLRALADRASDDGTRAFPGVSRIARESGYSERQVKRMLKKLKERRFIRPVALVTGGRGKATEYSIDLTALQEPLTYKKGDVESLQTVTSAAEKGDIWSPQLPESSFERSMSAHIGLQKQLQGKVQSLRQNRKAQWLQQRVFVTQLETLAEEKSLRNGYQPSKCPRRSHLEAGIFRKDVRAAYYDCTSGGLGEEVAVREAVHQAALGLTSNRAVELRDIDLQELKDAAFENLKPFIDTLRRIGDFNRRQGFVLKMVIREVVDAALTLEAAGQFVARKVRAAQA